MNANGYTRYKAYWDNAKCDAVLVCQAVLHVRNASSIGILLEILLAQLQALCQLATNIVVNTGQRDSWPCWLEEPTQQFCMDNTVAGDLWRSSVPWLSWGVFGWFINFLDLNLLKFFLRFYSLSFMWRIDTIDSVSSIFLYFPL